MIRALILLCLGLGLMAATPSWAKDQGRFVELADVASAPMPATGVTVWLPPGYDTARQRYGVIYMHDAQNLFFAERSNFKKIWAADKSALRLIEAKQVSPFIIVGINQPGEARYAQYLPQALYTAASPDLRGKLDKMAARPIYSDVYLRFLVTKLKPMIDKRFRTRDDRDHTAIVGSSMGGLISCYAFTRYPIVFGRAACVSTHWPMGNPIETEANRAEIVKLWAAEFARGLGQPAGRRLWMDHGDQTLDAFYPQYQADVSREVAQLGWRRDKDFAARSYPGAAHDENAWAVRLDDIFDWLLQGW
jgi:predicted alpha/beta superfamily hydrolase